MEKSLKEIVVEYTTRAYFTPNVTAETVVGCLLTPRIEYVVNCQCKLDTCYVAKEMSIPYPEQRRDNRGCKIDFVLADKDFAYLTELKTTPSSISEGQLMHYEALCEKWTFGESLGKRLLKILAKEFELGRVREKMCGDKAFGEFFRKIVRREPQASGNTERAQECVRTMEYAWHSWDRSKKYLLTLGEILDYLQGGRRSLWDRPLKIIYLAPLPVKIESPHVRCVPTLQEAIPHLVDKGDEYSLMLADILKGITKNSQMKDGPLAFGTGIPLLDCAN